MAPPAPRHRATAPVAAILAGAGILALAIVGLDPEPAQRAFDDQIFGLLLWAERTAGFGWITFPLLEGVGNLLLFIPVGAIAYLVIPRRLWPVSLLVGPALSGAIELGQWLLLPGRTGSVADFALNSLGAALGVGLAAAISLPFAVRAAREGVDGTGAPRISRTRPPARDRRP